MISALSFGFVGLNVKIVVAFFLGDMLGAELMCEPDDKEWTREVGVTLECGFQGLKGLAGPTEAPTRL